MTSPWPAPRARRPVDADVRLPGSKSVTNRALVIAALADGTTSIRDPLRSRDTELMAGAVRTLGATVTADGDRWVVVGTAGAPRRRGDHVDVGLAGTVARFVPPVAALADGAVRFDGDERMRERPMSQVVAALRRLGVRVDSDDGRLPLTVHGAGPVDGGDLVVDAAESSQVVSGLLLAAPGLRSALRLRHVGASLPSRPHVDLTVAMMRDAGADVVVDGDSWQVEPGRYDAREVTVEPDLSGAAPFVAAAVVTGGRVRVAGWPRTTTQPGARLVELATAMGATCTLDDHALTVVGPARPRAVEADLRDCSELVPVLAAVAALADGTSRLTGIGHMRGHETDRLRALAEELTRVGAAVAEQPDGLVVRPAAHPRGATLHVHGDHRLAMAYAVLGLAVDDVVVDDVGATAKTMPDFPERWAGVVGEPAP